jgi:site-specific DNA recombinase
MNDISRQELHIAKARKFFLDGEIDYDDFCKLKMEHNEILNQLKRQLNNTTQKLVACDLNNNFWQDTSFTIMHYRKSFKEDRNYGEKDKKIADGQKIRRLVDIILRRQIFRY